MNKLPISRINLSQLAIDQVYAEITNENGIDTLLFFRDGDSTRYVELDMSDVYRQLIERYRFTAEQAEEVCDQFAGDVQQARLLNLLKEHRF